MSTFNNNEFAQYRAEARERWGNTDAYRQHARKTQNYSRQDWAALAAGMDHIMAEFALCVKRGETPASAEAQHLVQALQDHITRHYYNCTTPILAGLGQMYVEDERFRHNIDQHGDGTAAFIREAIRAFCEK